MGLFQKIFGHAPEPNYNKEQGYFKTLTAYQPVWRNWRSGVYEAELVRSAVDAIARNVSKLDVKINGTAKNKTIHTRLKDTPNEWQTWGQFLYRLATILYVENTAFIAPIFDKYGEISGVFPILPSQSELVQYNDEAWIRYHFGNCDVGALKLKEVGIMTRHQFKDDFFGDSNGALIPTMELINIQNQGIQEGVKSSATYRFMAKVSNFTKPDDLAKERQRFNDTNLAQGGGVLLFPNTYTDIKQIDSKPYTIDANTMSQIKANVFDYFGVNEDILQNKAFGDSWSAFYEGCIEVFAIQFSDVMSKMLFTPNERTFGSYVIATSNRLQYMTNADKLSVSAQLADRGVMSINEVREIWQLPPVDGGDVRTIRGEYYSTEDKIEGEDENANQS